MESKRILSEKGLNDTNMNQKGRGQISDQLVQLIGFVILLYVLIIVIQYTIGNTFLAYLIALILSIAAIKRLGWF